MEDKQKQQLLTTMSDTQMTWSADIRQSPFWKTAWDGTGYYDMDAAADAIIMASMQQRKQEREERAKQEAQQEAQQPPEESKT